MSWDSTRPVPWRRLAREWLMYAAIMSGVFVLFMRDSPLLGIFAGLVVSLPLYLVLGFVLAKLGYTRKSWRDLRSESATRGSGDPTSPTSAASGPRPKPAPTRRTGGAARGRRR